jgi:hypothetical protein
LKLKGEDAGFSVLKEDSVHFCLYYAAEEAASLDLEVANILNHKDTTTVTSPSICRPAIKVTVI